LGVQKSTYLMLQRQYTGSSTLFCGGDFDALQANAFKACLQITLVNYLQGRKIPFLLTLTLAGVGFFIGFDSFVRLYVEHESPPLDLE